MKSLECGDIMSWNYIIIGWNLFVMLVFGADKLFARKGARRISEKALLILSFALGGIGGLFGMVIFNHKTSKPKFRFHVPLAAIFTYFAFWAFFHYIIQGVI